MNAAPRSPGDAPLRQFRRFLAPELRRHRLWFLLAAAGALLLVGVDFLNPWLQREFINALTARESPRLWFLLIAAGAALVLARSISGLYHIGMELLAQKLTLELKCKLSSRLFALPLGFLKTLGGGYLSGRLQYDCETAQWIFSSAMFTALTGVVKLLGAIVILCGSDWRAVLAILPFSLLYWFLLHFFRRKARKVSTQISEAVALNQRLLNTSLSNPALIKTNTAEAAVGSRLDRAFRRLAGRRSAQIRLNGGFQFTVSLIPTATQGLLLLIGTAMILRGQWTLGGLWALLCYTNFIFTPLRQLAGIIFGLESARAAAARILDLAGHTPEANLEAGEPVLHLDGAIQLEHVTFRYGTHTVLDDLSLQIAAREKVALTGASGSGKSTLVALLLGFYVPECGKVRFDGRDLAELNLRDLRQRIGYVGQNADLIRGSIAANLALGRGSAAPSPSAMRQALDAVGLLATIDAMPLGLNTEVLENGGNLSGGERLRLTLARELLRGCDLLLLDEATANLDIVGEQAILQLVQKQFADRTVLFISHRTAPLAIADRIVELRDGKAVERPGKRA